MLRVTQILRTATALSLALLGACDEDGGAKEGAAAEAHAKPTPKKPVSELFPGKNVELPPPLAALKFGTPEADAEAALAGITTKLVDLEGYEGDVTVGSFTTERGPAKVLVNVRLSVPSRAEMRKMFGDTMDKLGDVQASTDIHLLPTELESYTTTVWPTFDKSTGKIVAIRFTIPFEGEVGADKRLMDAMKKAWGEPKEEEKYGKKRYVFSEDPFLVVEDSIGRAWEIEKKAKRD